MLDLRFIAPRLDSTDTCRRIVRANIARRASPGKVRSWRIRRIPRMAAIWHTASVCHAINRRVSAEAAIDQGASGTSQGWKFRR